MNILGYSNIITAATAVIGTTLALVTFRHQVKTRQFEALVPIREQIKDLTKGMEFIAMLQEDSPDLAGISFETRANILGWLEVASTAVKSGAINEDIAYNFFGFYTIAIRRSKNFCHDIPENSDYWSEFYDFAKRMNKISLRRKK